MVQVWYVLSKLACHTPKVCVQLKGKQKAPFIHQHTCTREVQHAITRVQPGYQHEHNQIPVHAIASTPSAHHDLQSMQCTAGRPNHSTCCCVHSAHAMQTQHTNAKLLLTPFQIVVHPVTPTVHKTLHQLLPAMQGAHATLGICTCRCDAQRNLL
jgi:hypothetical protein